jgi:hypothetical protein
MVRVDASESFAVLVKHSRLPVPVLSPLVFPVCCVSPSFHLEILSRMSPERPDSGQPHHYQRFS